MIRAYALALFLFSSCSTPAEPPRDAGSGPECLEDEDCADGVFCNGEESCVDQQCVAGAPPCPEGCDNAMSACTTECPDADADGHRDEACGGDDCDDTDPNRYPGNTETCDDRDDDCDPVTVGDTDLDEDDYIDNACCNGDNCGTDCDDSIAEVHPTEAESCDGLDNDCDGAVDEGVTVEAFPDLDGDSYGDQSAPSVTVCSLPSGTADRAGDCDDSDELVFPNALDACNGRDEDCDGVVDEQGDAACASAAGMGVEAVACLAYRSQPPRCFIEACSAGRADCDGEWQTGCEVDLCTSSSHCNACQRMCPCEGGLCVGTDPLLLIDTTVIDESSEPVSDVLISAAPGCSDAGTTMSDSTGAYQYSLTANRGVLHEAAGFVPTLTQGSSRPVVLLSEDELNRWLNHVAVRTEWDERTGILLVDVQQGAGESLVIDTPSSSSFQVVDSAPASGTDTRTGWVIFVGVPFGGVELGFDTEAGCSVSCDAQSRNIQILAGTITQAHLEGCSQVCF